MNSSNPSQPLTLDQLLPDAKFGEYHERTIDRPIGSVWESFLSLPANKIRMLSPLFKLRGLPATLRGKEAPLPLGAEPALDLFVKEGFVILHKDAEPRNGRALLTFGAVGKFWSVAHNKPERFDSPEQFIDFQKPGYAKTVARFEAFETDGVTRLETETIVGGTDAAANRKFAPYWVVIRLPSGLLRRSWLSSVERNIPFSETQSQQ